MTNKHDSARERNNNFAAQRRDPEYYAGIDRLLDWIAKQSDGIAPLALKAIWNLSEHFNYERWETTGFYDLGGQPDGRGISQDKLVEWSGGVSPRSLIKVMAWLARHAHVEIRQRKRNRVTRRFEGCNSYRFPTPMKASHVQDVHMEGVLKNKENPAVKTEPCARAMCTSHVQDVHGNLLVNNHTDSTKEQVPAADAAAREIALGQFTQEEAEWVQNLILQEYGHDYPTAIKKVVAMCRDWAGVPDCPIHGMQIGAMAEAGYLGREGNRVWVPSAEPITNGHAKESRAEPDYLFEGTTIKLTARDYHEWERTFTYLDLRSEL